MMHGNDAELSCGVPWEGLVTGVSKISGSGSKNIGTHRLGILLSSLTLMVGLFAAFAMPAAQAQTAPGGTTSATDSTGQTITNPASSGNGSAGSGVSDNGGGGSSTGVGNTGGTPSGSGGSLASTGIDVLVALLAASLLILLGTSLTLAARRRHQAA